jgi:hypothetical protein
MLNPGDYLIKKLKNHLVSNPTRAKSAVLPLETQKKNISAFI